MKRAFVLLIVCVLLISCGSPFDTTMKCDEYKIEVLSSWESVEWEGYEVFLSPEDKNLTANVKITSQEDSKIKWGRIVEITEEYAVSAEMEYGYTLITDKYEFVPQARKEQRYVLEFSADQDGKIYTVIQHIYARNLMVIFVTGTYPEGDEKLGEQVKITMDSFLLAPKKGW